MPSEKSENTGIELLHYLSKISPISAGAVAYAFLYAIVKPDRQMDEMTIQNLYETYLFQDPVEKVPPAKEPAAKKQKITGNKFHHAAAKGDFFDIELKKAEQKSAATGRVQSALCELDDNHWTPLTIAVKYNQEEVKKS